MNIKVDNVTKIIKKVKVLDHVSLKFESGEITGLKGINGSGKTMIMRIISGLIRPTEGKVFINGRELKKEMDFPESIGVLIDSPAFLDGYSAYDNLRYMASVKNKVSGEEIKDLLKKVELADAGKKKYKYFSLGMKQRLGIAAAIMEHPDIILIDEPTNALDSKGVEMVKCILQQEKERGALIVLTCHDYSVLKELSDSIYFIEEGRIVGYELPHNTAVSTVMTNLGFVRAMEAHGIDVLQTKVGDRYVLEAMREGGYAVGGEQSGHMILLEHNSTGDGLVTACQFLAAVRRSGKPVEEAIKVMTKFPQTLINVRVKDKHALEGNAPIWDAVHAAEAEMGDTGRVLVRTSGTEPLVRVMVEAETQESADAHAKAIAEVVERELA